MFQGFGLKCESGADENKFSSASFYLLIMRIAGLTLILAVYGVTFGQLPERNIEVGLASAQKGDPQKPDPPKPPEPPKQQEPQHPAPPPPPPAQPQPPRSDPPRSDPPHQAPPTPTPPAPPQKSELPHPPSPPPTQKPEVPASAPTQPLAPKIPTSKPEPKGPPTTPQTPPAGPPKLENPKVETLKGQPSDTSKLPTRVEESHPSSIKSGDRLSAQPVKLVSPKVPTTKAAPAQTTHSSAPVQEPSKPALRNRDSIPVSSIASQAKATKFASPRLTTYQGSPVIRMNTPWIDASGHHPSFGRSKDQIIKPILVPLLPKPADWQKHKTGHHTPYPVGIWGGIRVGYIPIYGGDVYGFQGYETDCTVENCAPAPFYYYPNEPPYIDESKVDLGNGDPALPEPVETVVLDSNVSEALRQAGDDIVSAWMQDDQKALDRLTPTDGDVTVRVEGAGSYALKAKDFIAMFVDGINHTRTTSYKVVEFDQLTDGRFAIHAEHKFLDPWNSVQTVDHAYVLEAVEGVYEIREFRSSTYR